MKFMCFLHALFVAVVSAIDIRYGGDENCAGWQVGCFNHAPNRCCYLPEGAVHRISFGAVPGDWKITMRGHLGNHCDLAIVAGGDSSSASGFHDYCYFTERPITVSSGEYFFRSNKPEVSSASPANCSLVNGLIHEDGTRYSLHGLDEGAIAEAVNAAFNGTGEAAIQKFKLAPLPV